MNGRVTITRDWTYRSIQISMVYPAGWTGRLPRAQLEAAKAAGVIEAKEEGDGQGTATACAPEPYGIDEG